MKTARRSSGDRLCSNPDFANMQDLIAKAATLLEALPYIQKFSGATFIIKYGGSFMDSPDPNVRNGVARDIVFLEAVGITPVVLHGGGQTLSRRWRKPV